MPFYDYECVDCKHEMKDQLRKMSEVEIDCEKCGGVSKKQFSGRFAAHGLPNGHVAVRINRQQKKE